MGNLIPTEYNGQRILTTEQLAEIYNTDINNIKNNYNNHKENFELGKHYYFLAGKSLKKFKRQANNQNFINKFTSQLYLWTDLGCLLHFFILDYSTNKKLKTICKYFDLNYENILIISPLRKECEFGIKLMNVLENICNVETQKYIDGFKVDFYIPKFNLAIEFDEDHHSRQKNEDMSRQKYIENKIGCRFVRIKESEKFEISFNKILRELKICS